MKSYKDDILEIKPIIKFEEDTADKSRSYNEKSFQELFTEFYFKSRKVQPDIEVLETALRIMEGGDD